MAGKTDRESKQLFKVRLFLKRDPLIDLLVDSIVTWLTVTFCVRFSFSFLVFFGLTFLFFDFQIASFSNNLRSYVRNCRPVTHTAYLLANLISLFPVLFHWWVLFSLGTWEEKESRPDERQGQHPPTDT